MQPGDGNFMGTIVREVRNLTHDGQQARAVVATTTYSTDPSDLWDAITNPVRIPRWFSPVSGDLREGGKYQIEGNAGGRITRCNYPKTLQLTWEMQGSVSWVFVTLRAFGQETELMLEHISPILPESEEFWEKYGPGAVGVGWDLSLYALDHYVRTGEKLSFPESAEALKQSNGIEMIKTSSNGWANASRAYGTALETADRAEAATTAFYSGA